MAFVADYSEREIERIHDKLDRLGEGLARLAALEEVNAQILPRLEGMMADHESRLSKVEQHNWSQVEERLVKLEGWKNSVKGWIAGSTAVVTAAGAAVVWFLRDVASKLQS